MSRKKRQKANQEQLISSERNIDYQEQATTKEKSGQRNKGTWNSFAKHSYCWQKSRFQSLCFTQNAGRGRAGTKKQKTTQRKDKTAEKNEGNQNLPTQVPNVT